MLDLINLQNCICNLPIVLMLSNLILFSFCHRFILNIDELHKLCTPIILVQILFVMLHFLSQLWCSVFASVRIVLQ